MKRLNNKAQVPYWCLKTKRINKIKELLVLLSTCSHRNSSASELKRGVRWGTCIRPPRKGRPLLLCCPQSPSDPQIKIIKTDNKMPMEHWAEQRIAAPHWMHWMRGVWGDGALAVPSVAPLGPQPTSALTSAPQRASATAGPNVSRVPSFQSPFIPILFCFVCFV